MARIAIQPDRQELMSGRLQSFSAAWCSQLDRAGHEVRLVDAYQPRFFESLAGCDGFMWWFAHTSVPRNIGKRVLPAVEHGLGMRVFPSWHTIWHFDDKIAQQFLLEAAGIPVPETRVFWQEEDALAFMADARLPWVIKLASGITSENVGLLKSAADARYWIHRLFRHGAVTLNRDRPLVRPRSLARRFLNAAQVVSTGALPPIGDRTDLQKGYLLIQEFLEGNTFDTRITVIGNRAFAFRRLNRPNDFRASGSGLIDWAPASIAEDAVALAFRVARSLSTQSLAVDVLRRHGEPVINEISYYYEGWAVAACPGHWRLTRDAPDATLEWVDGQVTPEEAILADFLQRIGAP
jgi:glutathione synthase/RimK-type ligase-like ATP-grasp enzyme